MQMQCVIINEAFLGSYKAVSNISMGHSVLHSVPFMWISHLSENTTYAKFVYVDIISRQKQIAKCSYDFLALLRGYLHFNANHNSP